MSRPAYRIEKITAPPLRAAPNCDEYDVMLVGPGGKVYGRAFCAHPLRKRCAELNAAYEEGFAAGLEFNAQIVAESGSDTECWTG